MDLEVDRAQVKLDMQVRLWHLAVASLLFPQG